MVSFFNSQNTKLVKIV
uniref:Uncharacterized protein n=1 Tax=Anguilla anguilla TaxID=7936 RepID=A0A0E9V995_ANGAN